MTEWLLHVPTVGEDREDVIPFTREQEAELDHYIDHLIRHTALDPRVEWL